MIWQMLFSACLALPCVLFLAESIEHKFEVRKMMAIAIASFLVAVFLGWVFLLFWLGGKVLGL